MPHIRCSRHPRAEPGKVPQKFVTANQQRAGRCWWEFCDRQKWVPACSAILHFCDKPLTIRQDACNQEYGRFPLK
jgi:hypothetical protein